MDRRIRTSLCSIGTDLGLCGFKAWLCAFTGSLALQADAYHSFSDLTVSLCVLLTLGIRKAALALVRRKYERSQKAEAADPSAAEVGEKAEIREDAPIFRRANVILKALETLLALAVACMILRLAYNIAQSATDLGPSQIAAGYRLWIAIVGTGLCAMAAYGIGRLKIRVGRETDSPALEADGHHSRMDMLTSVGVMFSLIGHQVGVDCDRLCAVVIAVLVALVGVDLFVTAAMSLKAQGGLSQQSAMGFFWDRVSPLARKKLQTLIFDRIRWPRLLNPRFPRFWCLIGAVLLLFWGSTAVCIMPPGEQGLRLRFGRLVDVLEPGLHFHAPWPFETVRHLRPGQIWRVETGFRIDPALAQTSSPPRWLSKQQPQGYRLEPEESFVVTADENLLDVALVVHAKAKSARSPLLLLQEPVAVLRGMAEVNLRAVAARISLDDWLVEHRREAFLMVKAGLQRDCDAYGLETEILEVYGHDVHPPTPVIEAFRDVFSAREDQSTALHKAYSYQQTSLASARGDAYSQTLGAKLAKQEAILKAQGDAQAFAVKAGAFLTAPALETERLTLGELETQLSGKNKVVADPAVNRASYQRWLFSPEKSGRPLRSRGVK